MNTTTIRLPEMLEQYLSQTDTNASEIARQAVKDKFYNEMAGVCARCGDVVFITDGHTDVSISTPLGEVIDPVESVKEFDLCADCSDDAYQMMAEDDVDSFELVYLEQNGGYMYAGIRNAIADLGEGERKAWNGLASHPDDQSPPLKAADRRIPEQVLADLIMWANWRESVEQSPSDGLQSHADYTVDELLREWENGTIGFMYENIHIGDLIEDGVIPETAEEAIEKYSEE